VEPIHERWIVAKHILRYLCGMLNYGLRYASNNDVQLHGFTDSDWVGSLDDRKSTSGIYFSLGSTMISWASKKKSLWHSSLQKKSILHLVMLVRKQYGFVSWFMDYLIRCWIRL
jgi:hypothetical protein